MVELNSPGENPRTESELTREQGARPPRLRYGSALLSVALATFACVQLDPLFPGHPYYLWYVCGLLVSLWYGGVGAALFNLSLGPLALAFFVLHPRFSFSIEAPVDQFGLFLFCVTALLLLHFRQAGSVVRGIVRSSLEQGPLQEMPSRLDEIEAQLSEHIAHAEFSERQLTAEFRVAQILTCSTCISDTARPILQVVCEALGWEVGLFWIVDSNDKNLRLIESWGLRTGLAEEFQLASKRYTFSKGKGFPGRVWDADSVLWVADMSKSDLPRWKLAAKVGLHEAIGFPVRNDVQFLGVMEFFGRQIGEPNERLVKMMTCIGSQISQFMERKRAEKKVQEHNHERRLARQIQEGLLPKAMPTVPGFQIAARALFANEVGGDYFDFMPLTVEGENRLGIAIGDATGHGVAAALLIAEARAYLHALALTLNEPGTMLALANRRFCGQNHSDHFVTLLLVHLDPRKKALTYAGAGHCPGYVLDRRGRTKSVLISTGMPLGVDLSSEFPASGEVVLEAGDLVVLFTDGIVETYSPEGQLLGSERLLASVHQHQDRRPDEILDALFQAVTNHAQGAVQVDDATAVILKVEASPE
jgi:serine phosphatase RsbU (regulator of sigma subunit)